jgi:hypothetical protein
VRFPPGLGVRPIAWEGGDARYLAVAWDQQTNASTWVLRCDAGTGECERVFDITKHSFSTAVLPS